MYFYKLWPSNAQVHFTICIKENNSGFCLTCELSVGIAHEVHAPLTSMEPILKFFKEHPGKATHNADKLKKVVEYLLINGEK
jgi:hypothetical protein